MLQVDEDKSVDSRSKSKVMDVEITLYAFLGSPSPGTMRIQGKLNGHCLVILIDTGSTYNFVDAAMVFVLQLPLDHSITFEVKVANGASIRTQGVCSNVKVAMQGQVFAVDLNALALGDCKLVLGTQWLRTLGLIQWDFSEMSMVFSHCNSVVKLVGLQPTSLTMHEGTQFFKTPIKKGIMLQITSSTVTCPSAS